MGHDTQALAHLNQSLELKEAAGINTPKDRATAYNNIATIYSKQSKTAEAAQYYRKAMEACQSQTDP